jgi:hypothetical protein
MLEKIHFKACQDIIENTGVIVACQDVDEKKGSYKKLR